MAVDKVLVMITTASAAGWSWSDTFGRKIFLKKYYEMTVMQP
jgi:hypothetical protein